MNTATAPTTPSVNRPLGLPALVVVALGDSALLRPGEQLDSAAHRANIKIAAELIAEVAVDHRVVVIHGNGPQLGLLGSFGATERGVDPLGCLLDHELGQHLPGERLAALATQVVVDPDDPAFGSPTAFVGPGYDERDARFIAHERGWTVAPDGAQWRRVVPSPQPQHIVERNAIRILVGHDVVVTCNGGGGIPVVPDGKGGWRGVEAMIDADLSAALLAAAIGADLLVLLTDVDAVYRNWGSPDRLAIRATTPAELRSLKLPPDSIGPKAEAACRFVEAGGRFAGIGCIDRAMAVIRGAAGTIVQPDALRS